MTTPEILVDILADVAPAPDSLAELWRKLPPETVAAEQVRLRERFLELGGRLITINEIGEKQ